MQRAAPDPWHVDEGIEDPTRFFLSLPDLFPDATHLFAEGATVAEDVTDCYRRHADPGPYLPKRHTLWPRSPLHRCAASRELFEELARLSEAHASPELLDHLALYRDDSVLLDWPDAFGNALLLDGSLSESQVAALAVEFGCGYGRTRRGGR
jgi:hypothetical protein